MNMHTALWAVVDTETTGPDPDTAAIVEVAVALFRGGELIEPPRSWLLNPGEPIPEDAMAVHGISNEMVAGAPRLDEALGEICAVVASADVIVGYNALHFDLPLLARLGGSRWLAAIAGKPVVDPIVIVRHDGIGRYWKGQGRHRLGNVCERFGIDADGAHRAGADVVMTGRLLWKLGPLAVRDAGLPADVHALAAELARLQVGQEADYQAYRARMATQGGAA
ncbi:MAG: 3'-5' exonuclease [Myxococcales bacterium]